MKEVSQSTMSLVTLNQESRRVFEYTLNEKRANANILKGAKRSENLNVEIKSGCVNLRFSGGSYFEIILPLLRPWSNMIKEKVHINIVEVDTGTDKSEKHVDTKIVVHTNNERHVIHAYNGTQNVMVQGNNSEHFAINVLEPFFKEKVEASLDKIKEVNHLVKIKLGKKASKPFKCPKCEVETIKKCDLKVHLKSCHTKPGLDSPKRKKAVKYVNPNNSIFKDFKIQNEDEHVKNTTDDSKTGNDKNIKNNHETEQDPSSIEVDDMFSCEFCDHDSETKNGLKEHISLIHSQNSREYEEIEINKRTKISAIENYDKVEPRIIICGECSKGFKTQQDYDAHIPEHIMEDDNQVSSIGIKCAHCEFSTNEEKELKMHKQLKNDTLQINVITKKDYTHKNLGRDCKSHTIQATVGRF